MLPPDEIPPGTPARASRPARIGLLDVATACGVSRSTASLVLRGSPLVAEPTRIKVMEAMERLGYVYHRGAAMLREGRTRTVGLLVNDIANPYIAELVSVIDGALEREGQVSLLGNSAESVERQLKVLRRLREYNVDGIVFCPAEGTGQSMLDELDATNVPFVQTMRHVSPTRGDYVGADYAGGVALAVQHLVSLGHNRIAYVGGSRRSHSAALERLDGFHAAMNEAGLSLEYLHPGGVSSDAGADALITRLDHAAPPTAAICFNDTIAIGLLNRLLATNRMPGRDFSVIGFDDLPAAATAWPGLTTIATGLHDVGAAAARLLARRMEDPHLPTQRIVVPARLIVRASCGSARNQELAIQGNSG